MKRPARNDPCPCGSGRKYKQCCGALTPSLARDDAVEHWSLGNALRHEGRLQEAVACYRRALSARPAYPEAHDSLGTVFRAMGRLDDAIASYGRALALSPDSPHTHYNLGNALKERGKLREAVGCYRTAVALKPDMAEAANNLGIAYQALGQTSDAIAAYREAVTMHPTYAEAFYNLGTALRESDRTDEAIAAYRTALSLRPELAEAHHELGNALHELGQSAAALNSYRKALALEETPELKASFAQCLRGLDVTEIDPDVRGLVVRALSEPWARPAELAPMTIRLLMRDTSLRECVARASSAWPRRIIGDELFAPAGLARLASDPLLLALLQGSPVPDVGLERFLTMARNALLDVALGAVPAEDLSEGTLTFYCALARQCFINDFVFSPTDEELDRVSLLRGKLTDALHGGGAVPAWWVVAIGAYVPLSSLPSTRSLLDRSWPEAVAALLVQQVVEPLQERQYRNAMPRLTGVDDEVSRSVQHQYEENPYPRWVKLPSPGKAFSLEGYLHRNFPRASWHPFEPGAGIDILVAGCGTGREPIELAQQFEGARVLAVDLSLASLCYARRKTEELRLRNVEYAQADIIKLDSIGRTFDLVASVGVLHHLADPVGGWRKLLALLRPGGFMLLGLYSELGRRSVSVARTLIAERGYAPSAAGIRRCREELMSVEAGTQLAKVRSFADFYASSECRDLLFHVQEHRFTLPRLKRLLAELALDLVGFLAEPRLMKRYREEFPDDRAATNLGCWHEFETRYPDAFASMYVFAVQKTSTSARPAASPSP
jgi:Flp pilus assembly protein TadD/SAM-dependent methyltransferase